MASLPTDKFRVVVLISADAEWQAVKEILEAASRQPGTSEDWFTTRMGEETVLFYRGGWGKVAASSSTQQVIDLFHPEILVNLGTCGGLEGRIEKGTILLVNRTIIYDIIEQMSDPNEVLAYYSTGLDYSWLPAEKKWFTQKDFVLKRGLLVSADRDIQPADIPMMIEKFNAEAADWESGAIAWVARKNKVRCLILRGVTDLVGAEGGEAYGNIGLFHENTRLIMKRLIELFGRIVGNLIIFTTDEPR